MNGIILTSILVIVALTAAFTVGRSIKRRRTATPRSRSGEDTMSHRGSHGADSSTDTANATWFAAIIAGMGDSGSHRSSDSGSSHSGSSHDSGSYSSDSGGSSGGDC